MMKLTNTINHQAVVKNAATYASSLIAAPVFMATYFTSYTTAAMPVKPTFLKDCVLRAWAVLIRYCGAVRC